MVRNIAVAVLVAVVLMVTIQQAFAIKCYMCANCGDPFDKEKHKNELQDCRGLTHCVKGKGTANGQTVVGRSCGPENSCDVKSEGKTVEFCEVCKEDGCNGAVQHGAMAVLVGLLMTFVALL